MPTIETTLHTEPIGGGEPLASLPAEIIRYGYRLNRPGSCSFALALDHATCSRDLVGDTHEIVITRNGAEVWRGPIDTPEEEDSKSTRVVRFGSEGLATYLKGMYVTSDLTYSSTEQFTIARGLVDHHQNKSGGDYGIDTSGADTSGVTRSRTYYGAEHKNIYDAVVELAEVNNGFDWWIAPSTRLMTFAYPKRGQRKPDLVFDERTIRSFKRSIDRTAQASQVLGVGAGEGDDMLRVSLTDAPTLSTRLLKQAIYTNKDVKVEATLEDHVRRELELRKAPPEVFSITVGTAEPQIFGAYDVGDEGRLKWASPYDPVDKIVRIVGFDIVWNQGTELANLFLQDVLT